MPASIPCLIKAKLVNGLSCCWNGCLCEKRGKWLVVSTLSPLVCSLSCKQLKAAQNNNYANLLHLLLEVNVFLQFEKLSSGVTKLPVSPVTVYHSQKFSSLLNFLKVSSLFHITEVDKTHCCSLHNDDKVLSYFISFSVIADASNCIIKDLPDEQYQKNTSKLEQGETIWTKSFPFGEFNHTVFTNCVSKGIICNVVGDTAMLIDACCLPGSEGCGVYYSSAELIGVVVCPLILKTKQVSGLSIACTAKEIFQSLDNHSVGNIIGPRINSLGKNCSTKNCNLFKSYNNENKHAEVVLLQHQKGWGSGVVVAINCQKHSMRVYVSTCRHVVEPALNSTLYAKFLCGSEKHFTRLARVIYSTSDSWLDFAFVEIKCSIEQISLLTSLMKDQMLSLIKNIYHLKFAKKYMSGAAVIAAGHCLYQSADILPTVTKGVISNTLYHYTEANTGTHSGHLPILLHSNCIVLDGASGGGLFSVHDNNLYGVIVNNVKMFFNDNEHVLYPQINFVLPSAIFMPPIVSYLHGEAAAFSLLDELAHESSLKKYWMFSNSTGPVMALSKF